MDWLYVLEFLLWSFCGFILGVKVGVELIYHKLGVGAKFFRDGVEMRQLYTKLKKMING